MRSVVEYAETLTRSPASVAESHVLSMRDAGLSDEDVLSVNLVVAYFNFVNRIATGLGVGHSAEDVAGYRY